MDGTKWEGMALCGSVVVIVMVHAVESRSLGGPPVGGAVGGGGACPGVGGDVMVRILSARSGSTTRSGEHVIPLHGGAG